MPSSFQLAIIPEKDQISANLGRNFWITLCGIFSCGMRVNGEITMIDDEENYSENELHSISKSESLSTSHDFPRQVVVGYALTSKKKKSFLQPMLELLARNKGILFVPIDQNRPLSEQGPFDVILHKLLGKDWSQMIEDYGLNYPEVAILDPPHAIQRVHNRQSMLEDVAALNLADNYGRVCVPNQLVIIKDPSSIPTEVMNVGLTLPLVAKPLFVDGTSKSHELFLVYDKVSLTKLDPPLILQEFVNHGGVMFKVYVIGEAIKVVRRFSLPDICKQELPKHGVFQFPRVSCASASAENADLDPAVAELPPRPLLEKLVKELRQRLGLRLFNIDIIREHGTRDLFYVIDINYFPGQLLNVLLLCYPYIALSVFTFPPCVGPNDLPSLCPAQQVVGFINNQDVFPIDAGYGKMPDYETIFTDFLMGFSRKKDRKRLCI